MPPFEKSQSAVFALAPMVLAVVIVIVSMAAASDVLAKGGPATVSVSIPNGVGSNQALNFSPSTITVAIGINNTIEWTNQDSVIHTVTSTSVQNGASSFDSGNMSPGGTYSVTLTTPGTYEYHCTFHPAWMTGKIVVKYAPSSSTTTTTAILETMTSTRSSSGGSGIPEFPFQIGISLIATAAIIASYLLARRFSLPGKRVGI